MWLSILASFVSSQRILSVTAATPPTVTEFRACKDVITSQFVCFGITDRMPAWSMCVRPVIAY